MLKIAGTSNDKKEVTNWSFVFNKVYNIDSNNDIVIIAMPYEFYC